MANMFDENGNYNKTEWKPGDRIAAGKLNKIEDALEAINNNDIERHKEADERLDALEEQKEAVEERFDELEDLVADNKTEVDTAIYEVHSKMDRLEQEMNDGIDTVEAIAHTVDDKIAEADVSMKAQVAEVEADLEGLHAKDEELSEQLTQNTNKLDGIIDVRNYGAKGDGVTDDTEAIKLAISDCVNYNTVTLQFKGCISFLTSETIEIPSNVNLDMEVPLTPEHNGVGMIVVGNNKNHIINIRKKTTSDWADMNNIGVILKNNNECFFKIIQSSGFTIGIKCIGDADGFAYNNLQLGRLYDNRISLLLTNVNDGWCNENIYIGGRFSAYTSTNKGLDRYGVVIDSEQEYYNNNNVFLKPSFELKTPNDCVATPIIINYGRNNSFYYIRNETNSKTTVICNNDSTENIIETGYSFIELVDNSNYPTNTADSIRGMFMKDFTNCIYDSERLVDKTCLYDGKSTFNVATCHIATSGTSNINKASSRITLYDDYIEMSGLCGLGVFVDTQNVKKFLIKKDYLKGFAGRVHIRCYDESDNILDASDKYIKGTSATSFMYMSNAFGGSWKNQSDTEGHIFFQVGDIVKKICVILTGGTNVLKIKRFGIYSSSYTNAWIGYTPNNINLGTIYPNTLTWEKGTRIINDAPGIGKPKSWVCIESGTPGVWVSEGNLENPQ